MRRCTNVVMVIGLLLVATGASWAFSLFDYVEAGTPIKMKYVNYDVGAIYSVPDDADPLTPGVQPYVGEAVLNGLPHAPVTGAFAGEDGWGILKVAEIYAGTSATPFWSSTTADEEITGIFWGYRDTYLAQTTVGTDVSQDLHSVGMHTAFFSQEKLALGFTAFDASAGPSARVNLGLMPTYATVTDGDLMWTFNTVPGANNFYPTDELFTTFIPTATVGQESANGSHFDSTGSVPGYGVGPQNGELAQYLPGIADATVKFTGIPDPDGKWTVISDDPIRMVTSPELSSSALMLLGFVPMGLGWWRRRKA